MHLRQNETTFEKASGSLEVYFLKKTLVVPQYLGICLAGNMRYNSSY